MSYRETIAVYLKPEHMNTVRGRSTEFLVLKCHYTSTYKPSGFKWFTQIHDLTSSIRFGQGIIIFQSDSIVIQSIKDNKISNIWRYFNHADSVINGR